MQENNANLEIKQQGVRCGRIPVPWSWFLTGIFQADKLVAVLFSLLFLWFSVEQIKISQRKRGKEMNHVKKLLAGLLVMLLVVTGMPLYGMEE